MKKWLGKSLKMVVLTASILLLVLIAACGCNSKEVSHDHISGMIVNEAGSAGMTLSMATVAAEDGQNTVQITAAIEPALAAEAGVDWSIRFKDPSSSWASGKTVTDYVELTPDSDGALQATVGCIKSFGEQIIVTATSRYSAASFASCTIDYEKRIEDYEIMLYFDDDLIESFMQSDGPSEGSQYFKGEDLDYDITVPATSDQHAYSVQIKKHFSDYTIDKELGVESEQAFKYNSYVTVDEDVCEAKDVFKSFIYMDRDINEFDAAMEALPSGVFGLGNDTFKTWVSLVVLIMSNAASDGSWYGEGGLQSQFQTNTVEDFDVYEFWNLFPCYQFNGKGLTGSSDTTFISTYYDSDHYMGYSFYFHVTGIQFPILDMTVTPGSIVF